MFLWLVCRLCVTYPMAAQALFAREDQAGGKKKVAASMITNLFSSSVRLVGKMRVRLSTITANTPLNVSMPLQGESHALLAALVPAAGVQAVADVLAVLRMVWSLMQA